MFHATSCPKRLQPSDYIDLSGLAQPVIALPCGRTRVVRNGSKIPFPPNTRGFFYYHTPPKAPPYVGELRFRCANSLEDFPNCKDLLSTDKFNPWSILLAAMATQTTYLSLREQLMLDDLASQTTRGSRRKHCTTHSVSDQNILSYITSASPFSSVSTVLTLRSIRQQKIELVFV